MNKFKSVLRTLGKGLVRTLWGSALGLTAGMAVYGYASIRAEGGWTAVAEFIVATATLVVAVNGIYFLGGNGKGGSAHGKYEG